MAERSDRDKWGKRELIVTVLMLLGGLALAFGITTPGARIEKLEAGHKDLEGRMNKVEQKVDDIASGVEELLRRTNR